MVNVQDVLPDEGGSFIVDEAVLNCLPEGTAIVQAVTWGSSAWTKTAKIITKSSDGIQKDYFLKCATERGHIMMEGEFRSISTISELMPGFAPKPYGWGKFISSDTYFLVMDFLNLKMTPPSPAKLCQKIAQMHKTSISPTGKFGFHVPTCHGKNIQPNNWESSWATCFTTLIQAFFDEDVRVNGSWPEYDGAFEKLKAQVIPRILGALQDQGRILKPCLVHGDLWDENTGIDVKTAQPVIFDASVFYAHNEYEIGMWRREIIRFNQPYIRQYLLQFPPSEPTDEFDDRNRLYSIKFNLGHSISFPGSPLIREQMYNDMVYLNNKYDPAVSINNDAFSKAAETLFSPVQGQPLPFVSNTSQPVSKLS